VSAASETEHLTPRRVVEILDRFVIGQHAAKRAVSIALRNRWRRQMVEPPLRDEISPKNIIMIGPTGVGKTEIARRLARLSRAPFVKIEVSKFTEVGYVGRDVDSVVRDLVDHAMQMVREEMEHGVMDEARTRAGDRIVDLLLPPTAPAAGYAARAGDAKSPGNKGSRDKLRALLDKGKLDDREVEIEVEEDAGAMGFPMGMGGPGGGPGLGEQLGQQLRDALGKMGRKTKQRKVRVAEARELLAAQEARELVDREALTREAIRRTEQVGMVFLDEIDKISGGENMRGAEISRQGVQRDLLPLVEGTTVHTKYGPVKTDHVLFIAAGAFHLSKVSDLIPELQGRFPIRVELDSLTTDDFVRILAETENSLLKQYTALLGTEGVELVFTEESVRAIAEVASEANASLENIGARRLHTVLERVLEELSFEAPDVGAQTITITPEYVRTRIDDLLGDVDLSRHIL
jgi:ATP-dependent HslUV protease ATP-binding subunit HslU